LLRLDGSLHQPLSDLGRDEADLAAEVAVLVAAEVEVVEVVAGNFVFALKNT